MRFNLDKIVKNLQSRAPSMYLGTVTEVSSDARCSVLIDGTDYPIAGIRTLAHVAVRDRVQLIHDKRRIVILGAIQRTDKLVADTIARSEYLPDGTDLDDQTVPGVYAMSGSHTYANNPVPGMWGFLEVTANTTGAIIRQVASRTNRTRYERWYISGAWSAWEQL